MRGCTRSRTRGSAGRGWCNTVTPFTDLGPPPAPLPPRWWAGLNRRARLTVIRTELHGRAPITTDRRGYVIVYIGRGNPYASPRSGTTRLHRWIASRTAGRRLQSYEHAHHSGHTNSDNRGLGSISHPIEILHAVEHGTYHYGRHFERDPYTGRLIWVGAGIRMTDAEIAAAAAECAQVDELLSAITDTGSEGACDDIDSDTFTPF